ncbi:MAG: metallophosphoesterase [Verrucomicrobiae bacterium]
MKSRRKFLGILASALAWFLLPARTQEDNPPDEKRRGGRGGRNKRGSEDYVLPSDLAAFGLLSLVLGRVTDRSVTVSALAAEAMEGWFEYGTAPGKYDRKTDALAFAAGRAGEVVFDKLQPDTQYFYRMQFRKPGDPAFTARQECRFHTQRSADGTFTFGVQGDSHPERPQMSDPELYARTLLDAASGNPDFYICMGDDFSVARVRTVTAETLAQPYTLQRPFLGLVAQSAPLFLINGNHEQASLFNYNQPDIRHEVAVGVQNARNHYYPTPGPDGFYSGDTGSLKDIGLLKDYYAWTWGDALFVILDNYWQSPVMVDSGFHEEEGRSENDGAKDRAAPVEKSAQGSEQGRLDPGRAGHKDRDWWGITLGNTQYQWFKQTLEQSKARYKFVFAHHVLGSGRGGIDECDLYEWGGKNKRGDWEFGQKRPGWELPIHQLMVKNGVTIFFQGHDHLFARQERDGIVYQEVPMPADPFYEARNDNRYQSGIKLPNSGHLRVTVSPGEVKVDYVRCYLPKDENDQQKTGQLAHTYTVKHA